MHCHHWAAATRFKALTNPHAAADALPFSKSTMKYQRTFGSLMGTKATTECDDFAK